MGMSLTSFGRFHPQRRSALRQRRFWALVSDSLCFPARPWTVFALGERALGHAQSSGPIPACVPPPRVPHPQRPRCIRFGSRLPVYHLSQNQSHSHGCHHQFHQPSEGISRSNGGVQFDKQPVDDE